MIRARAQDAKFVGSSIGGAHILIRDARTKEILAQGTTTGSTGSTETIMKQPHQRRVRLSDENTAGFLAELSIEQPTFVTIEAHAPANAQQAQVLSSTQVWLIPEKDIIGEGIVLEIPGFIVDILSPTRHQSFQADTPFEIQANIEMMCGCPITDGGLWNAEDYEVKALLSTEKGKTQEVNLSLTDTPDLFSGKTKLTSGFYTLTLYAYDSITGNTGVDKTNIIIE